MSALICGSLAFDTITTFPGRFAEQILPEQVHILNVSFLVPTLRREFGGCAGNIAYTLQPLGGEPVVMAAVGSRRRRLPRSACASWGVDAPSTCAPIDDSYTAQAIIITDTDNNQITAFHPGAMQSAHQIAVPARADTRAGDHRARRPRGDAAARRAARAPPASRSSSIRARACRCSTAPSCAASSSRRAGSRSTTTRREMLCERTGQTLEALSRSHLRGIVVTLGAEGCDLWQRRRAHARARRGGDRGASTRPAAATPFAPRCCTASSAAGRCERCAELGNRLGALKIASRGGQNHVLDRTIASRPEPRAFLKLRAGLRPKPQHHGPRSNALVARRRPRRRLGRHLGGAAAGSTGRKLVGARALRAEEERPEPPVLAAADGAGEASRSRQLKKELEEQRKLRRRDRGQPPAHAASSSWPLLAAEKVVGGQLRDDAAGAEATASPTRRSWAEGSPLTPARCLQ